MTIPSTLKAYIVADGQRQKEYPDEDAALDDESPNLASTYIECKSGSTFVVQFEIRPSRSNPFVFKSDAIDVQVFLDGRRTKGQLINRSIIPSHGGYCCKIPGVFKNIGERWEFRPFVFREIRHAEENPGSIVDMHQRNDLGSVTVKAFHVTLKGTQAHTAAAWDPRLIDQPATMPEKTLKGLSVTHSAALGQQQAANACTVVAIDYVDGKDSPLAVFRFKLCSRKALQAMLLIPRTPSPSPRASSPVPLEQRPVESLSVDEMQQLLRRYQRRSAEPGARTKLETTIAQQHIKHEKNVKPEPGLKRERDEETEEILASAYVKKAKRAQTIDLSED